MGCRPALRAGGPLRRRSVSSVFVCVKAASPWSRKERSYVQGKAPCTQDADVQEVRRAGRDRGVRAGQEDADRLPAGVQGVRACEEQGTLQAAPAREVEVPARQAKPGVPSPEGADAVRDPPRDPAPSRPLRCLRQAVQAARSPLEQGRPGRDVAVCALSQPLAQDDGRRAGLPVVRGRALAGAHCAIIGVFQSPRGADTDIQDRRRFSARDMGVLCVDTVGARGIGVSWCATLGMGLRRGRLPVPNMPGGTLCSGARTPRRRRVAVRLAVRSAGIRCWVLRRPTLRWCRHSPL